jgi:glycerol-3-phosphate acyltransferase PlsY
VTAAILIGFAYLLGSMPTGFLLGYFAGVDVREAGSGNVGATNVARVAGKWLGLLTLVVDAAKGFVPVFLAQQMDSGVALSGVVALAAFFGHLYPIFLKFQGGKGVATALGVLLALAPAAAGILALVFLLVVLVSRIVSLASIVAAGMIPAAIWLLSYPSLLAGLTSVMALMIVWRHRENIRRLVSGVEPKFNF